MFLCKEFWMDCFKKRVDNLKTNNRQGTRCHPSPVHHHNTYAAAASAALIRLRFNPSVLQCLAARIG